MAKKKVCSNNVKKLPPELWGEIGKRIGNQVDLQMFRSTCKSWRAHLPSPLLSLFPVRVPPPPHKSSITSRFYVAEHTGYLFKSETNTSPNLVVFERKPEGDGRVFFPFRLFPGGPIVGNCKSKKVDMQKLSTTFVFKTYYIHYYSHGRNGESNTVLKLVLLSYFNNTNHYSNINPLYAASCGIDLAAVSLLPDGNLAHLTLNNNTTPPVEWKLFADANNFDDIFNYRGKLWGVDINGGAFVMNDYCSLKMTQVAASPAISTPIVSPIYVKFNLLNDEGSRFKGRKRLVESSNTLYMLFPCRDNHSDLTNQIKVFQLTLKKGGPYPYEWVEVKSIGNNKAFFVGLGFGFSMVVRPELGLNGNCIYLNGMSFCRGDYSLESDYPLFREMSNAAPTTGVYSLTDKEFRIITSLDSPLICWTNLDSIVPDSKPTHKHRRKMDDIVMIIRQRELIKQVSNFDGEPNPFVA